MADANFDNAVQKNIIVRRNDNIDITFTLTNYDGTVYDLTAFTGGKMQVKADSEDVANVLEFVSPASMTIDDVAGTVRVQLNKSSTDVTPATYVYDVELENATDRKTFAYGKFIVKPDITR